MMPEPRFYKFLEILLKLEGGVSNHLADKGGLTNLGVTQATYDDYNNKYKNPIRSVKKIQRAEVEQIYLDNYYTTIGYIEEEFPHYLMFDLAVNSGPGRVQQCVREVHNPHDPKEILTWRRQYYNKIVGNNPAQGVFLKGWMNRLKLIEKEFKDGATTSS